MSPECQELLQCLERTTARLAGLNSNDEDQLERVLAERSRAIDGMTRWIAAETASRPVSPELACHLTTDLQNGAKCLVRMALNRENTRLDLLGLGRELQIVSASPLLESVQ